MPRESRNLIDMLRSCKTGLFKCLCQPQSPRSRQIMNKYCHLPTVLHSS